jgi:hypothetical protein
MLVGEEICRHLLSLCLIGLMTSGQCCTWFRGHSHTMQMMDETGHLKLPSVAPMVGG